MVNTFLYSVYGQAGGNRHVDDPAIAAHRHRWLDALLPEGTPITAVITLGTLAKRAYATWAGTRPDVAAGLHHAPLRHPTCPPCAPTPSRTTPPRPTLTITVPTDTRTW